MPHRLLTALPAGRAVSRRHGMRNYSAFMGGLAALSFWIEYRTRSVSRGLTGYSIALAGATADVTPRTSVWVDLESSWRGRLSG